MPKYKNHTKTQTIVSQILLHRIISKIKAQIYLYVAYHQPAILFTRFCFHTGKQMPLISSNGSENNDRC